MLSKINTKIATAVIAFAMLVLPALVLTATTHAQTPDLQGSLCQGGNSLQLNTSGTVTDCTTLADAQDTKVNDVITLVINVFSLVVGVIAVIMIIVGGLKYITSGGDSGKVTSAKNSIIYAVIGLVIVALAQVIVRFVLSKTAGA